LIKGLEHETPEAKNWVYEALLEHDIPLYYVEGYSVKGDNVTALFERFKSTVKVEEWTETEIAGYLETGGEKNSWEARIALANLLDVPLYLVLWQDGREVFRIFSVSDGKIKVVSSTLFTSCRNMAQWLSNLKGIAVSKGFSEAGRLSFIDECLRRHGVPWPGNLDGFLFSQATREVKAIVEFSRTRKYPVRSHNLNLYFSKDINRWKPLDILGQRLQVPLYIVIWSSDEKIVKLHEVKSVEDDALEFKATDILTIDQLVDKFNEVVA